MITLITAGLVVVKDRQLLLAYSNNKKAFYLPGGKADQGESTDAALVREVPGVVMIMQQLQAEDLID